MKKFFKENNIMRLFWQGSHFLHKHEHLFTLIALFVFSTSYVFVPLVRATSLVNIRDIISSSRPGLPSNHTISFSTISAIDTGGKIRIEFPAGFTNILQANVICPASSTASVVAQEAICTATSDMPAGPQIITVNQVTNPNTENSYSVVITTENSSSIVLERSNTIVAITNGVVLTAYVPSTLTFTVSGTSTGVSINGVTTTATTTATSTPFGTLIVGATSTAAHDLSVTTNASYGYVVTLEQDHELRNSNLDTINSFDNSPDGTGSTTPHVWNEPTNTLDQRNTYGHMGITTNDSDLGAGAPNDGYADYAGEKFAGLSSTTPVVVLAHANAAMGSADGKTQNKGFATVAYVIRVSGLQEAGDYTNTLTYICTPTF